MTERSFVDTNILVYSKDDIDPRKQDIAEKLIYDLYKNRSITISNQVLNEYISVMINKFKAPLDRIESHISTFIEWNPIQMSPEIYETAFELLRHYKVSTWDALIIAAAVNSNCKVIYSEDLSNGMEYLGVKVVNPFK